MSCGVAALKRGTLTAPRRENNARARPIAQSPDSSPQVSPSQCEPSGLTLLFGRTLSAAAEKNRRQSKKNAFNEVEESTEVSVLCDPKRNLQALRRERDRLRVVV
jgi:hypothetical protein